MQDGPDKPKIRRQKPPEPMVPRPFDLSKKCKTSGWHQNCGVNCLTHFFAKMIENGEIQRSKNHAYNELLNIFKIYYQLEKQPSWDDIANLFKVYTHPVDREIIFGPILRLNLQNLLENSDYAKVLLNLALTNYVQDITGDYLEKPFINSNLNLFGAYRAEYAKDWDDYKRRNPLASQKEIEANKEQILNNVILKFQTDENNYTQALQNYAARMGSLEKGEPITSEQLKLLTDQFGISLRIFTDKGLFLSSTKGEKSLKIFNAGVHWEYEGNNLEEVRHHNKMHENDGELFNRVDNAVIDHDDAFVAIRAKLREKRNIDLKSEVEEEAVRIELDPKKSSEKLKKEEIIKTLAPKSALKKSRTGGAVLKKKKVRFDKITFKIFYQNEFEFIAKLTEQWMRGDISKFEEQITKINKQIKSIENQRLSKQEIESLELNIIEIKEKMKTSEKWEDKTKLRRQIENMTNKIKSNKKIEALDNKLKSIVEKREKHQSCLSEYNKLLLEFRITLGSKFSFDGEIDEKFIHSQIGQFQKKVEGIEIAREHFSKILEQRKEREGIQPKTQEFLITAPDDELNQQYFSDPLKIVDVLINKLQTKAHNPHFVSSQTAAANKNEERDDDDLSAIDKIYKKIHQDLNGISDKDSAARQTKRIQYIIDKLKNTEMSSSERNAIETIYEEMRNHYISGYLTSLIRDEETLLAFYKPEEDNQANEAIIYASKHTEEPANAACEYIEFFFKKNCKLFPHSDRFYAKATQQISYELEKEINIQGVTSLFNLSPLSQIVWIKRYFNQEKEKYKAQKSVWHEKYLRYKKNMPSKDQNLFTKNEIVLECINEMEKFFTEDWNAIKHKAAQEEINEVCKNFKITKEQFEEMFDEPPSLLKVVEKDNVNQVAAYYYLKSFEKISLPDMLVYEGVDKALYQELNEHLKLIKKNVLIFNKGINYQEIYTRLHDLAEKIPLKDNYMYSKSSSSVLEFHDKFFIKLYENESPIVDDIYNQLIKKNTMPARPGFWNFAHPDNWYNKVFSGVLGRNYNPLKKNNVPYVAFPNQRNSPKNIRFGVQVKDVNTPQPAFLNYVASKARLSSNIKTREEGFTHAYFNLLKYDKSSFFSIERNSERKRSLSLHNLERQYPGIAVMTLPADGEFFFQGFDKKKSVSKKGELFKLLDIQESLVKSIMNNENDFYLSEKVKKIALINNANIKDLFMQSAEFVLGKPVDIKNIKITATQRQAILSDFIKFKLSHYLITKLKIESFNFSCKDGIDRGASHNLWYEYRRRLENNDPMSEDEFRMNLDASAILVKGRPMNEHRNVIWNVLKGSFSKNPELYAKDKLSWVGNWLIENHPNKKMAETEISEILSLIEKNKRQVELSQAAALSAIPVAIPTTALAPAPVTISSVEQSSAKKRPAPPPKPRPQVITSPQGVAIGERSVSLKIVEKVFTQEGGNLETIAGQIEQRKAHFNVQTIEKPYFLSDGQIGIALILDGDQRKAFIHNTRSNTVQYSLQKADKVTSDKDFRSISLKLFRIALIDATAESVFTLDPSQSEENVQILKDSFAKALVEVRSEDRFDSGVPRIVDALKIEHGAGLK